jgi:hypothetical protein
MLSTMDAPPVWPAMLQRARTLGRQADMAMASGCRPGLDWLARAAHDLVVVAPSWEQAFRGDAPAERSYRLITRTEGVEVWVIWWPCGGRLEFHDHGGASGAFAVASGTLHETFFDPRGKMRHRAVGPGDCVAFDADHVHDVVNVAPAGATSVHLYSPPTSTMTFYRLDGGGHPVAVGRAQREECGPGD